MVLEKIYGPICTTKTMIFKHMKNISNHHFKQRIVKNTGC